MSLTLEQLQRQISEKYQNVEQVGDTALRFSRTNRDNPFAIYYIDLNQNLPSIKTDLTKYQDQLLGTRYFDGPKSLQWNNYLYFLVSKERLNTHETSQIKEIIENDRNYARKYVVSEEELEAILSPQKFVPTSKLQQDIVTTWRKMIDAGGFSNAIFSDDNIPDRLRFIEESKTNNSRKPKKREVEKLKEPLPFIRQLNLMSYRKCPIQRQFIFGQVNLIFGPNASGKTSLLEAIEYAYCGRHKRNPGDNPNYQLEIIFQNDTKESVDSWQDAQVYRDRNLVWYGQTDIKTNSLFKSFGRYNFLDTDAAVHFSNEKENEQIEEDLSKLLVGTDAAKTWRDIQAVKSAVDAKLKDLLSLENQLNFDLTFISDQQKISIESKKQSDHLTEQLKRTLSELQIILPVTDKQSLLDYLIGPFSELKIIITKIMDIVPMSSSSSYGNLDRFIEELKNKIADAEPIVKKLGSLNNNLEKLQNDINKYKNLLALTKQFQLYLEADIPRRIDDLVTKETISAKYTNWLVGIDLQTVKKIRPTNKTLKEYHNNTLKTLKDKEKQLNKITQQYTNIQNLQEETTNYIQQLRQISLVILKNSLDPDICPLCHTKFIKGQLLKHIQTNTEKHFGKISNDYFKEIDLLKSQIQQLNSTKQYCVSLENFRKRAGLPSISTISSLGKKVASIKNSLNNTNQSIDQIEKDLKSMAKRGFTTQKFTKLTSKLISSGYFSEPISTSQIDKVQKAVRQDLDSSIQKLESTQVQIKNTTNILLRAYPINLVKQSFIEKLLIEKNKLSEVEQLKRSAKEYFTLFGWFDSKPLKEMLAQISIILSIAIELQVVINKEKQSTQNLNESLKRRENLNIQLSLLRIKLTRFQNSQTILGKIIKNYSLSWAMKDALQQNRKSIESIFRYIHSPSEFTGLGTSMCTLIRNNDKNPIKLSEISTGQRTAFALSIYLAQNAQLVFAPPVILMDDPIAHVDDLNSLSFLDYLREIAISGSRQIFFATADEKIASLFERKFDFLGQENYRRFNLQRKPG